MATFARTPAGTCKGILRTRGWPATIKSFRTNRDAIDWARRAEDKMVWGVYPVLRAAFKFNYGQL